MTLPVAYGNDSLFSIVFKDVSVLSVTVMDQSSMVHKLASSLSVARPINSEE